MTNDLVIGIDSSTSATKAIAWDRSGHAIAEGRKGICLANPQPGYFEQNPDEWWDSAAAALRDITGQVDPARIAAVAVSNQRETIGAFAEDGTAIRPAMTWLDERARRQVSALWQVIWRRARSCHFRQTARCPALPLPHYLDGRARAGDVCPHCQVFRGPRLFDALFHRPMANVDGIGRSIRDARHDEPYLVGRHPRCRRHCRRKAAASDAARNAHG